MQVYTSQEVAEKLKLNVETVYDLINAGKLRAFKIGKRYRITEEALQDFIKSEEGEGE